MRPILVLGAARSGTKFLRDTLGASSEVALVPYDVNFIWRTGNEALKHDALESGMYSDEIGKTIRTSLQRAAGIWDNHDSRRILEKTVSNTLRLEFVARVFPQADFIHLVRDGRDVVESSIRQWNVPTNWKYVARKARAFPLRNYRYAAWYLANQLKNFLKQDGTPPVWGVRYKGIDQDLHTKSVAEICAHQWVASVEAVRQAVARRPDIRIREIRYEDLMSSDTVLRELVDWLNLSDVHAVIKRYRESARPQPSRPLERLVKSAEASAVHDIISPLQQDLRYGC